MKKLLLGAITALAFLFGFASCGGLTNLETEALYLAGDMNSYSDEGEVVPKPNDEDRPRNTFTQVNKNTQTYKFTYHNNMDNWGNGNGKLAFKVCYDASSWKLDWGWKQDIPVSLVVNDTEWLELEHRDSANSNPGNIVVEDLLDGEEYTIEVDYDAPATSVKIKIYGNKPDFPSLRFVVVDKDGNTVKEIPLVRDGVSYSGEFASETAGAYSGYLTNGYLYWGGNESFATDKSIDLIDFEVEKDEAGNVKMCYINVEVDPANLLSIKTIEFSDIIDTSILGVADIIGGFEGWKGSKLTRVNDTTYTFDFTNNATEIEFDIREKAASWNVGRWFKGIPADTADRKKTDICDDIIAAKKGATPVAVTPIYYKGDSGEDGKNLKITGLPYKAHKFRLTATIVDADKKKLSLTVQALDDIPEADYVKPDTLYKADGIAYICSNYGNYEIAWGEKKADGSYEGTVTIPAGAANAWGRDSTDDISFGVTNDTSWGVKYVDGVLETADTPVKLTKGGATNNTIKGVNPSEKDVVITVISTEDSISVKYSQ